MRKEAIHAPSSQVETTPASETEAQTTWYIECVMCKQQIRSNKPLSYDWKKTIIQDTNLGKYLVNIVRRHCRRDHPSALLWNAVPETRYTGNSRIDQVEYLIHHAMRAGGSSGDIPEKKKQQDFANVFSMRIGQSLSWLRWNKMAERRMNRFGEINALRTAIGEKIDSLHEIGLARIWSKPIWSKPFIDALASHSLEQMFNTLMLFFFEMGRYKSCPAI